MASKLGGFACRRPHDMTRRLHFQSTQQGKRCAGGGHRDFRCVGSLPGLDLRVSAVQGRGAKGAKDAARKWKKGASDAEGLRACFL